MNISAECITCIFSQSLRVAKTLELDEKTTKLVLDESAKMIPSFDMQKTPPENAAPMYEMIAKLLDKEDIYKEIKEKSVKTAETFIPFCEEKIKNSSDKFLTATKIAVAGNVIDLASEFTFDLGEEIGKVLDYEFAIDDSSKLFKKLSKSKKVVYLADNAGENIFDKLYIKTIKSIFKDIEVYYFVRANPIINDITENEAYASGLDKYTKIIDSGVPTPGLMINMMSEKAKELFESADCIISKGMGNFECLNGESGYPIFFLLKVKCNVVAKTLHRNIGDIICKKI